MAVGDNSNDRVESATVKRRRLRNALRQARENARVTQREAAAATYWSLSKVVRIETGVVPVTPSDVRALLHAYRVTDEQRIKQLIELANEARSEEMWDNFRDIHSANALELFAMEGSAAVFFNYEAYLIPGLLQTEEYTRALMSALGRSGSSVARMVEARLMRQKILERPTPPEFHCIIGEAALSLSLGAHDLMRDQLQHLRHLRRAAPISLSILPFSSGVHRPLGSSFLVLQFRDAELPDLLHREFSDSEDSTIRDDPVLISDHVNQFIEMQAVSLAGADFDLMIDHLLETRHRGP